MHPLRRTAEAVIPAVLPARTSAVLLAMTDRYAQYRRYRRSDSPAATRRIEEGLGLQVRGGPFRGMIYPRANAYSRHSIPKLLGCYEEELHPWLARFLADPGYRRFVDIGSAEGYYSVGFAMAARRPVYAFEIEPFERRYTRLMARANGVDELVTLSGWCSPAGLRALCADRSFVLCDCEGYESVLFTPDVATALRHTDLIVELHRVGSAQTLDAVVERFSPTHEIHLVTSRERRAASYPELAALAIAEDRFVSEFRQSGQQWAVIMSREHLQAPGTVPSKS